MSFFYCFKRIRKKKTKAEEYQWKFSFAFFVILQHLAIFLGLKFMFRDELILQIIQPRLTQPSIYRRLFVDEKRTIRLSYDRRMSIVR
jgi:hypothetical protein